jgi:hypothetical protein
MNTVNRRGGDSNHTDYLKTPIHSLFLGGIKFPVIHCSIIFKTISLIILSAKIIITKILASFLHQLQPSPLEESSNIRPKLSVAMLA